MVNFIIGYIVLINVAAMILIWLDIRTNLINLKADVKWVIYILLSILGAAFAVRLTFRMFEYKLDDKRVKYIIPLILFAQFILLIYIVYKFVLP